MKIQYVFLFICFTHFIYSENVKELEKKKKNLILEIDQSNQVLKENKKLLINTLQKVDIILQEIIKKNSFINNLDQDVKTLNDTLKIKEKEIEKFKKKLDSLKQNYTISIQKMYLQKHHQEQYLFVLLASTLKESYYKVLYWKEIGKWRKLQSKKIFEQENRVNTEKQLLQQSKKRKFYLILIEKEKKENLQSKKKETKNEIEEIEKKKKNMQFEIEKKKKQAKILENEINQIIKMEIANAQKASKKDLNTNRKIEIREGYAMTKKDRDLSANFSEKKGNLPFPIKGDHCIVSRFGEQSYEGSENIHYNNNGIDIKTTKNNTAKSIFDGVVTRIFILPGYQSSVIIRHGNFLTLYSYLEQVFVKQGERVMAGQNIGKIYTNSEKNNSTILHFELWKEQIKLNPELWFCK